MFKDKIYIISPHIDDSFFSLWFLINNFYKKWFNIKIINIFTKTNFLLERNDNNAEIIRIEEEKLLLKKYKKLEFINLWFEDAILRWYDKNTIFSLKNFLEDWVLISKIKEKLEKIFQNEDKFSLFLPIWFWNHIDHILISKNIYFWNSVFYYEDLPYVSRNIKNEFALNNIKNKKKIILDFINENDFKEHLENIKIYKTQLSEKHYNEILNYIIKNKIWIWIKNIF